MQQKVRNDKPFVVHDFRIENPSFYIGPPDFIALYKKEKERICLHNISSATPLQLELSWAPEMQWP